MTFNVNTGTEGVERDEERATGSRTDKADVFVSYASQDAAVADAVVLAFEHEGLKCWIAPRDVSPGESYASAIVHAIDAAKATVLIMSQHAAASPHVAREVERAASKRHRVVSMRIDGAPLPADLEYFLNTSQWLDASNGGLVRAMPLLVAAVRLALERPVIAEAAIRPTTVAGADAGSSRTVDRSRKRATVVAVLMLAIAVVGYAAFRTRRPAATPAVIPAVSLVPEKSVAVLPFVDMSEKKDKEYFSDGLSEELIDHLAHAPGLKVIARTSSFQFKGKNEDIRSIAEKLGVSTILEGSVRSVGRRIRVTAQLVRAHDGLHLWSQSFDRQVDDIFKVQDEIAGKVADALSSTLAQSSPEAVSEDPVAYDLYLKANYIYQRQGKGDAERALEIYKRAVEVNPNYEKAWVMIGGVEAELLMLDPKKGADWEAKSIAALRRALAINPDSSGAHRWLGRLRMNVHWDWAGARSELKQAIALDPHRGSGDMAMSDLMALEAWLSGDFDALIAHERGSLARNPLDTGELTFMALVFSTAGRFADALEMTRRLLELHPDTPGIHSSIAYYLAELGRPQEAGVELKQENDEAQMLGTLPILYWVEDKRDESTHALEEFVRKFADENAFGIASAYAFRGDADAAVQWLERAYTGREGSMIFLKVDPDIRRIRSDPRYQALLRKMNMPVSDGG